MQGCLREPRPGSGFPELSIENRTVQEQWQGHLPMPKEDPIPQIGAVTVHRGEVLVDLVKSESGIEPTVATLSAHSSSRRSAVRSGGLPLHDPTKCEEARNVDKASSTDSAPGPDTSISSGYRVAETSNEEHSQITHDAICNGCEKVRISK